MIIFKFPILPALRDAGYSSTRLRREKIIGERVLTRIRAGLIPSAAVLSQLCELLDCQPGDLLAYVPDDQPAEPAPDQPDTAIPAEN